MKLPGPFRITRVAEFEGTLRNLDFLLRDVTPADLAATKTSQDPRFVDIASGRLIMACHSLIVETKHHVILVDTCVGNDKERPELPAWHKRNGPFLNDLAAAGYPPEKITHVMCTHLHPDHVGWNTRLLGGTWVPTFPNAKYIMHRIEVSHAEHEGRTEGMSQRVWRDSVQPIIDANQALIVDNDYEIEPGVRVVLAPGHTPGNAVLVLDDGKERACLVGDTLHHPVQIERPQWSSHFCWDPVQSAKTRAELMAKLADNGAWMIPAHFSPPCAVRITCDSAGFWYTTDKS